MPIQDNKVSPTFERIIITPAQASFMLQNDTHNRNVKRSHVLRLSRVIERDEWQFNGQPIQIAPDKTILDGGHRLRACVLANKPIDVLLIQNAEPESQKTMDMGVSRNVADILTLQGFKQADKLAAFVGRVLVYQKGNLQLAMQGSLGSVTPGEIVDYCQTFTGHERYVTFAVDVARSTRMPSAVIALAMWITDEIDLDDSEFFWSRFKSGAGLEEGSPILTLRNWALDPERLPISNQPERTGAYARIFKTWNKFRSGESMSLLRWIPGGSRPEAFPEPK